MHHHTNFTLSCDSLMFFGIILFIIPSTYVLDDHFIYVNVLKMIKRLLKSFANRINKSFNFGLWSFSFPDDTWDILWKIYSSPVLKNRSLYKTNSLLFSSWSLFQIHSDYTLWEFTLCAVYFFFLYKELVTNSFPTSVNM